MPQHKQEQQLTLPEALHSDFMELNQKTIEFGFESNAFQLLYDFVAMLEVASFDDDLPMRNFASTLRQNTKLLHKHEHRNMKAILKLKESK